jgi:hypothetical protein
MARYETGYDQTEAERRKRTKEVYEGLISAVDHNSGNQQPPLAKQSSVIGTLHTAGYGRFGLDELHKAITAARRNGDLFQAKGSEGRIWLGIDDDETLVEKVQTNFSRVDKSHRRDDVIGLANRRIQKLRGEDDG